MKKFLYIIEQYNAKLVNEQDAPPPMPAPPPEGPSSPPAPAPQVPTGAPEAPVEDQPEQPDVPAGIATMGNMLKKALTMKLSDEDRFKVSQLPEINENNANEIINTLISIMKSYSADVDVGTE